jgi:hypothetical protein
LISRRIREIASGIILLMTANTACAIVNAIDSESALAEKAQNPVENMITIPFTSNFNFNYGSDNQFQYILNMKPVIPFSLNDSWNLITRTIIPVQVQPKLPSGPYMAGIGDISPTFYLSPSRPGKLSCGIGPAFILPTATHYDLGQGKYSLGPTAVLLMMPGHWVVGALATDTWSIGGQSSRPSINLFSFQYFINYNFKKGWYVTSQPTITANRQPGSRFSWTIPFGGGAGRVFNIGKQPVNATLQAYMNAKTPQYLSDWQIQFGLSFLFPKT